MASSDSSTNKWDEIQGFATPGEFQRFRAWITDALAEGVVVEVPVGSPYSGSSLFDERWYQANDGTVWRLVAPEAPFRGVFEPVNEDDL